MSEPTALPLTERQAQLMHGIRRDGGDWSPARACGPPLDDGSD